MNGHGTSPCCMCLTTEVEAVATNVIFCSNMHITWDSAQSVCCATKHVAIAITRLPFLAGMGAAAAELEPLSLELETSWGMMMGCLEATRLSASRLLTFRQAITLPYWLSCRQVSSFSTCMAISLRSTPCTSFLLQRSTQHGKLSPPCTISADQDSWNIALTAGPTAVDQVTPQDEHSLNIMLATSVSQHLICSAAQAHIGFGSCECLGSNGMAILFRLNKR